MLWGKQFKYSLALLIIILLICVFTERSNGEYYLIMKEAKMRIDRQD